MWLKFFIFTATYACWSEGQPRSISGQLHRRVPLQAPESNNPSTLSNSEALIPSQLRKSFSVQDRERTDLKTLSEPRVSIFSKSNKSFSVQGPESYDPTTLSVSIFTRPNKRLSDQGSKRTYSTTLSESEVSISSKINKRFSVQALKSVNPTPPSVIGEVVKKFGGGRTGQCHTLVYFDRTTMSDELLRDLQTSMGGAPVMLLDVTNIKFGLITVRKRASSLPVIDLLVKRPEKDTCRVLLSWSQVHFQRSLLVLARFYPNLVKLKDTLILSTEDKNIKTFIPELRRRIIVRRSESLSHRNVTKLQFIVEQSCTMCNDSHMQAIGEWGQNGGMTWKRYTENEISEALIKVSYTPSIPNIFNTSEGVLDGLEYRMLQYVSEALNFSYTMEMPLDREWGRIVNGSWTGKVGDVVYKRADLAIGGIVYKSERLAVASYSSMFHHEPWRIVCPPPIKMPLWPYVIFPFRSDMGPSVKVLVLLHIIAFVIVTSVFTFRRKQKQKKNSIATSVNNVLRVAASFYLRIMTCLYFWNLFYCVLETWHEEPIQSPLGLLRSSKKYGLVRNTTVEAVLANSLDASHRELAKKALLFSSITEALYNVDEYGMCIVGVPTRFAKSIIRSRYMTQCGEPALQVSAENLHTVMGGWLMAKDSPLKEKLDSVITRIQGFGFLDKWRSDLYASLSQKREERLPCMVNPVEPLSLKDLRLVFILILVGWATAIALYFMERVAFNFVQSFDTEFAPTYVQHLTLTATRNHQPRPTWTEQLLDRIIIGKRSRRVFLRRDSKPMYHIYSLLRDITEGDFVDPVFQSQNQEISSAAIGRNVDSNNLVKTERFSGIHSEATRGEVRLPSSCSQKIVPRITLVQPYETPLSRAVRVIPQFVQNQNIYEYYSELPNTVQLSNAVGTPCKSSARNWSGISKRNQRIQKETLWHIGQFGSEMEKNEEKY